jgi:hypothetical protein
MDRIDRSFDLDQRREADALYGDFRGGRRRSPLSNFVLTIVDRVGQADRALKAAEAALGLPPRFSALAHLNRARKISRGQQCEH